LLKVEFQHGIQGRKKILKELCVRLTSLSWFSLSRDAAAGLYTYQIYFYMKGYCCIFSLLVFWGDWAWACCSTETEHFGYGIVQHVMKFSTCPYGHNLNCSDTHFAIGQESLAMNK